MKTVLVAPLVYLNETDTQPHMGLFSLKAVLEQHGHSAKIISLSPIITESYESCKLKKRVLTENFYNQAVERLLASAPEIIGFSTIGVSYPTTLLLVKMLKAARPDLIVILGGIQATLCAEETMHHFPEVDYIIAGEAEFSLPVFLRHIEEGIPFPPQSGVYYRSTTEGIAFTGDAPLVKDLNTLPMMDYSQLDLSTLPEINIDVGRGCPFQCYYCCTNNYWRRTHRLRSAKNIVDEIEYHYHTSGKQIFAFNHDLLTCNHMVFKELLQTLKERNLPIRWRCSSRIDTINEELLENMAETGCYDIFFGIETGSSRMQKVIRKNLDLSKVLPLLEKCRKLNIRCTVSFICGMPEETMEDIVQTVEMVYECIARCASPQIHLLAPFQGTDLYHKYKDHLQFDGTSSNVGGFVINNQLEEEMIKANPDIFCNFYYIDNPHVPRKMLRDIEHFPRVLQYFWRTIGILRDTHQLSLTEIFLSFLRKPVKKTEIPDFIRSWVNSIEIPTRLLKDIFDFELSLYSSRIDEPNILPQLEIKPEYYFRQKAGSKLYPLSFDPAEVEESIRCHLPYNKKDTGQDLAALISATCQGMMPGYCTVPGNSSTVNIYNDANGELRVQDIIDEATKAFHGTYTPEEVQEAIINIFKKMEFLRLVSIEPNSKN